MRVLQAPTVSRGEPITSAAWNRMAGAINGEILAPLDLDSGAEGQRQRTRVSETQRTSADVRVENPDDEDQYVVVSRASISVLVNTRTREEFEINWLNES